MNTLTALETAITEHLQAEEKHLLERCKLIARIHHEELWREGGYKSFRLYMSERWGIEKTQAFELVKIGTNLGEFAIADSMANTRISHLQALASIAPDVLPSVLQSLEVLPTDLLTARNIALLADMIQEWMVTGNTFELFEGRQLKPNVMLAMKTAVLVELTEKQKRKLDHVMGRSKPSASFSGYTWSEAMQHPEIANLPRQMPVMVDIYDRDDSFRVVFSIVKEKARV